MTDARRTLKELLGSTIISKVGFRDNYVIIGKQGLPTGSAIEAVSSSYKHCLLFIVYCLLFIVYCLLFIYFQVASVVIIKYTIFKKKQMTRPEWRVQGTKPLMYSHP